MVTKKVCTGCKEEKDLTEFNKDSFSADKRRWKCKLCEAELIKKKRLKHINNKQCKECGKDRLCGSSVCLDCFFKQIARNLKLSPQELKNKLEEQNFRCFYTNTLLLPGINASLDHIIPKSKGGSNELNNLVWVDFSVNRMKNNLDLETFYSNYSSVLIEYKRLASLESSEVQQSKLNYVLGLN